MKPLFLPHTLSFLAVFLACFPALKGQDSGTGTMPVSSGLEKKLSSLPMLDRTPETRDWLVKAIETKSAVYRGELPNQLVLDNGLARRTFLISPEVATVGLENLYSKEKFLRSVKPEGLITLDGVEYRIGGLTGQPVHNYLRREWLQDLKRISRSFHCVDWKVDKIQPRFPWKPRTAWLNSQGAWPPKGIALTFEYKADALTGGGNLEQSSFEILWKDDMLNNNKGLWHVKESPSSPRNSFINEGKFGEIMADANSAVFAERDLPQNAQGASALIDPGTDEGATYGPGLALVWKDFTAKLHVRPSQKQLGVSINGEEVAVKKHEHSTPVYLRILVSDEGLIFQSSPDATKWENVHYFQGETPSAAPQTLRVGKLSMNADGTDHRDRGAVERSFVKEVSVLGKEVSPAGGRYPLEGITINIKYELYDGLPLMGKSISLVNRSGRPVTVNKFSCELLGIVEAESPVESKKGGAWTMPNILAVTDYSFGSMTGTDSTRQSVHWEKDPEYVTQVNYERTTPAQLRISPQTGPNQVVEPGMTFESFRSWILLLDSTDRERNGLAERRMYRTLAPWVEENPIMMHVRHADDESVKRAIDQCADVGFEMVILTFGSGFNFESRDPAYQKRFKKLADYAHSKNIALGGYSLLSSRNADPKTDNCVIPKATHGVMPCLGATWGREYLKQLENFTRHAGFDILEHDGSYPGDTCASTGHPHHRGFEDSQWVQWRAITSFYQWCRANGVYLNIPDWYYLNGGNKCAMGYREANWSLPRDEQEIIERQNIYDGTWTKTPGMGWMFVPLTEYQGGGKAATIEPLKDHLEHYETRLANLFGAGVQACYRGPRLYDTEETRQVVKRWVDFYKKYRPVLDSDIIHLRRADGQDWDGWLHVRPEAALCGLAMIYNPLNESITRKIRLPLYYTGLETRAKISIGEKTSAKTVSLNRDFSAEISITIPAKGRVPVFITRP